MSALFCCLRRAPTMGAALSQPQDDGDVEQISPPTMADVIRERKKKGGGATLGTLRRRIAAAARRPRDCRPDKGCEHARLIRTVVQNWRLAEVVVLQQQLTAAAALRDLCAQADLARAPAPALHAAVHALHTARWWCDVELVGSGWSLPAHRAILAARCAYFRRILHHCSTGNGGVSRVSLSGAGASLSRNMAEHVIAALYCPAHKMDQTVGSDDELESISGDTSNSWSGVCECGSRAPPSLLQRLGARLDSLQRDLKYLLDSGEYADASLSFRGGSGSAAPLPCHRAILAARSRLFRSIMSRHSSPAVVVDERVLPRRFAAALLHAAYTDQVDLTLIGRPSSPNGTANNNTTSSWSSLGRSGAGSKVTTTAMLEDAFQLYEIASFVEMPIAVQGCEDAIVEALSPETLPTVLRWSGAPAASQWVYRQAMRYLVDEFPLCLSAAAAARLPPAALRAALRSPFLQCSEHAALRAAQRWAAARESPTLGAGRRKGGRRGAGAAAGAGSRHALKPLLPLIRTEHIPPQNDVLQQAIRRGLVSEACSAWASADAWLGRGLYRPARCLLPYLDALQSLVEGVRVSEAELARVRRAKCLTRMPDTLYMVGSTREPPPPALSPEERAQLSATLPASLRAALLARCAELARGAAAQRAAQHHAAAVCTQIALRAVRERSLPDACAELLLPDMELAGAGGEQEGAPPGEGGDWDCCRSEDGATGGVSDEPRTSRNTDTLESNHRRELPALVSEGQMHRAARLSRLVPDVLAPNANTHLLNYPAHTELVGAAGPVLQLDLGDGATHSPRPGSRAQRQARQQREQAQLSCPGARAREDDDLRAAIEMSVIRAYSYNRASPTPQARPRNRTTPRPPLDLGARPPVDIGGPRPPVDIGGPRPPVDIGGPRPPVDIGGPRPPVDIGGPRPLDLGGPFHDRALVERSNERLERSGALDRNCATLDRLSANSGNLDRRSGNSATLNRLSGNSERQSNERLERSERHSNDRLERIDVLSNAQLQRERSINSQIDRLSGTLERLSGTQSVQSGTLDRLSGTQSMQSGTLERLSGTQSMQSGTLERLSGTQSGQSGTLERLSGTQSVQSGTLERVHTPMHSSISSYSSNLERNNSFTGIERSLAFSTVERNRYNTIERSQSSSNNISKGMERSHSTMNRSAQRTPNVFTPIHSNYFSTANHLECQMQNHREHRDVQNHSNNMQREVLQGLQGNRSHNYRRRSREREAVMLSVHQGVGSASPSPSPSPVTVAAGSRQRLSRAGEAERERRSPRHGHYARYTLEASFPGSASSSRGPSPNNYA